MRKILTVISIFTILSIVGLTTTQTAHAQTEQLCQDDTAFDITSVFGNVSDDSNDLNGQTFIAPGSFSIGAIKINAYRQVAQASSILNVYITDGSGVSPNEAPDMNVILGTEQVDTDVLPDVDLVTLANNNFSCVPLVDAGQYIVFDPPVAITSGQQYGIVFEYSSGATSGDLWIWPYDVLRGSWYADGHHWDCNVVTACSRNTPTTWDIVGTLPDIGFAVFDNFVVVTPQGTADTWLENFLTDFLGLDSTTGKLIFGLGFTLVIMVAMLLLRVHVLPTMAFGGFATATAALGTLVPVELFLAMFALLGAAMLIGATIFRSQGEE